MCGSFGTALCAAITTPLAQPSASQSVQVLHTVYQQRNNPSRFNMMMKPTNATDRSDSIPRGDYRFTGDDLNRFFRTRFT